MIPRRTLDSAPAEAGPTTAAEAGELPLVLMDTILLLSISVVLLIIIIIIIINIMIIVY